MLNEEASFCLKKDAEDCIVEPFQVYGMTSLNANFRGYEYTITGLVEDLYYWDASKIARRKIDVMNEQNILMAEERSFFSNLDSG